MDPCYEPNSKVTHRRQHISDQYIYGKTLHCRFFANHESSCLKDTFQNAATILSYRYLVHNNYNSQDGFEYMINLVMICVDNIGSRYIHRFLRIESRANTPFVRTFDQLLGCFDMMNRNGKKQDSLSYQS
jgi:hypothetical protein